MGDIRIDWRNVPRASGRSSIVRLADYLRARPRPTLPVDVPRGQILLFTGVMYERGTPDSETVRTPDQKAHTPRRRRR